MGPSCPQLPNLALPCFIASIHSSEELVQSALGRSDTTVSLLEEAVQEWTLPRPEENDIHMQRRWDNISSTHTHTLLVDSTEDLLHSIRLNHIANPEAGSWLNALPSQNLGTTMSDDDYRVAVALRLGLDLAVEFICVCGKQSSPDVSTCSAVKEMPRSHKAGIMR